MKVRWQGLSFHNLNGYATPKTPEGQVWLTNHCEISSLFHAKVTGNRSPYDGDWVYWSRRRGHYPTVPTRVANLLKRQSGRCAYCGLYFQHDDQLEVDHINPTTSLLRKA